MTHKADIYLKSREPSSNVVRKSTFALHELGVLGAILTFALCLRLIFKVGILGTDDIASYASAIQFIRGSWFVESVNMIATLRYGMSLAMAPFMAIFNVSEASALIFPVLSSLFGIVVVWDIVRRLSGSLLAAHGAAVLTACSGLEIASATTTLPDGSMSSFSMVALWLIIVAEQTGSNCRRAGLHLLAGLLMGYLLSLKETGFFVFIAYATWASSFLMTSQFRWHVLLGFVGFMLAVSAEHFLIWWLHGDPFYRWKTISHITQRLAEQYDNLYSTQLTVEPYLCKVWNTLIKMSKIAPYSVGMLLLGTITSILLLARSKRHSLPRLIVFAMGVFWTMRLAEFLKTYSFQPRRFVPGILLASCILGLILPRVIALVQRKGGLHRFAFGSIGLSLVVAALLGVIHELRYPMSLSRKTVMERNAVSWLKSNTKEVKQKGFYSDNRTLRLMNALSGFAMDDSGMAVYPFFKFLGEFRPPLFTGKYASPSDSTSPYYPTQGYWLINKKYVNWLSQPHSIPGLGEYLTDIPSTWALVDIIPGENVSANGPILEIMPPEAPTTVLAPAFLTPVLNGANSWTVLPEKFTAHVSAPEGQLLFTLEKGEQVELVSPWVDWTTNAAGFAGDVLLHPNINISSDFPNAGLWFQERSTPREAWRFSVEAQDLELKCRSMYYSHFKPSDWIGVAVIKPTGVTQLRVKLTFTGPGTFSVGPILARPKVTSARTTMPSAVREQRLEHASAKSN